MKDIPKFTDNDNIDIPDIPNIGNKTIDSPTSQSPRMFLLLDNLSSNNGESNSSQHPIGSKKAKLKRKIVEGNNSSVNILVSSNEKNIDFF